jgi:peptidoglycan-associated lipoprotein
LLPGTLTAQLRRNDLEVFMNARSWLTWCAGISLFVLGSGCAHETIVRPTDGSSRHAPSAPSTGAQTPANQYTGGAVSISGEIMAACNINSVDRAPKFDFDQSVLQEQDRGVLAQVAKCFTTGPLKGRSLKLIGRADPRGEVEYNFVLGEHRAGGVESYLAQLGVSGGKMIETSRGKLDANGSDEAGWQRDRRVDLTLQ